MNATATPKVGDVVILVRRYGARPETTNIDKVTPKGWLRVAGSTGSFRPKGYAGYESREGSESVFLFSDETLAGLNAVADEKEASAKAKAESEANRKAEAKAREEAELAEVKAVMSNLYGHEVLFQGALDGSRLHVINLPIKPGFERKGGFETLIVRLKDVVSYNWDKAEKGIKDVEANVTYANADTASFPSLSSFRRDSDEEAIWEAIHRRYHDSW